MKKHSNIFSYSIYVLLLMISFTFVSCSPKSLEDFREEGEALTRSLIRELQLIKSREDLLQARSRLQKLFNKMAVVMIEAQEFCDHHPTMEALELTREDHELSDKLRIELNRIYHLDEGREMIEKCQEGALQLLDNFKNRQTKKMKKA